MKKAFTLIELLVVIAIIAILAAILFPVFAQAKLAAKKTVAISNMKQYGIAGAMYLADNDDHFMFGFGARPTGTWGYTVIHPYPAGWFDDGTWATPGRIVMANEHPMNSVQPYVKNLQLSEVAGGTMYQGNPPDYTATRLGTPGNVGMSYNGYLHSLSSSAVAYPSIVPMYSTSMGLANMQGRALTSPALRCDQPANADGSPPGCIYSASATSSADGVNGGVWFWPAPAGTQAATYSGGIVVARTDSSAKFIHISAGTGDTYNTNILEPWFHYTNGGPVGIRLCAENNSSSYYACFFSPDQDGTRTMWSSILDAH